MSVVTNLFITCSASEDEDKLKPALSLYLHQGKPFRIGLLNDLPRYVYGGTKNIEATIFFGVYNHLDLQSLVNHLRTIQWENPEDVQVILKEQHDFKFRIIDLFEDGTFHCFPVNGEVC